MLHSIHCLPDNQEVSINETETLLEAMLGHNIPVTYVCGGHAQCSTCRVSILDGLTYCTPQTSAEKALSQRLGFPDDIRLACQTGVTGPVSLRRLAIDTIDIDIVENQLATGSIGERKNAAVMFVAVRGMTNFDEARFPYDIIYTFNRYFYGVTQAIERFGGRVNNHMGGRLLALFGMDDPNRVIERAVWAGLEILNSVETLNTHLERLSYAPLRASIGIHYGPVLSVVTGSQGKQQITTVLGDAVVVASRIETANRELGSELAVSASAYGEIATLAAVGRTLTLEGGKGGELRLHEIVGMQGEPPAVAPPPSPSLPQRMRSLVRKFSSPWGRNP